ncbi:hypothetical protein K8T06_02125, partial [bacterium]|nr:hypothetical protein [bacterium]
MNFVLFAGDADQIPVRYTFHADYAGDSNSWQNIPADLYYADLYDGNGDFCDWDGNANDIFGEYIAGNADQCDFAPDVLIGRNPASTITEFTGALNKTIHYEDSVTGTELWQNRIVLAAADTFTADGHGDQTGVPEGEATKEVIAGESLSGYNLVKLYETERYARTAELTTESLNTAILDGAQYVNFANHGWVQGWAFNGGSYSNTQVNALDNYDHLPIVFGYACSTGVFDTENSECPSFGVGQCLAEAFILNSNGGSVGYYGATRTAFAGGHGFGGHSGAFGLLDRAYFQGVGQGHTVQGRLWLNALMKLLLGKGITDTADYITVLEFIYFGDPSLSAGGAPGQPDFRTVSYGIDDAAGGNGNGCVEPGETVSFSIELINDGDAASNVVVELSSTSADITIVNGSVALPDFARGSRYKITPDLSISVAGACPLGTIHPLTLTITCDENSVLIDRLIFVGTGPHLIADQLYITQDQNGDNIASPGESIKFAPGFVNIGCEMASGILAEITIDDPWVLEYGIKGDGTLPDMNPYVKTISQKLFYVDLDPMTPDNHEITCDMIFTLPDMDQQWEISLPIIVKDYVMPTLSDFRVNPATPEPGETVTITVLMQDPAGVQEAKISLTAYESDQVFTATMYDDGLHDDGAAGDMIFGAFI